MQNLVILKLFDQVKYLNGDHLLTLALLDLKRLIIYLEVMLIGLLNCPNVNTTNFSLYSFTLSSK